MGSLLGVVGAGGFGREVLPLARDFVSNYEVAEAKPEVVFVESFPKHSHINDVKVMSEAEFFSLNCSYKLFNIAVGSSSDRNKIAMRFLNAGCKPVSLIAKSSVSYDFNKIGIGATLCDNVIITSNAVIGDFFQANIYSYVAHDCRIGDFVTFGPRVSCNGNVWIDDFAYIGTGAILKQGSADKPLKIGRGAIVGMGAVVTKDVAPETIVVGNPAKPMVK